MRHINVTYPKVTYDLEFSQSCCEVALRSHVKPEIVQSQEFQLALQGAVAIATTTYAHLENVSTRQWICLYTTWWEILCESLGTDNLKWFSFHSLIYFDDLSKTEASSVREFHARFVSSRPQMHPLLDYYAELLRNAGNHFLPSCANLVVSSSLDFVTGLMIDYDLQKMPVCLCVECIWFLSSLITIQVNECATSYPRWFRTMMGVSTAFVIFTFPPEIPLEKYIQILPNMVNYIDDVKWVVVFLSTDLHNNVPCANFFGIVIFFHSTKKKSIMRTPTTSLYSLKWLANLNFSAWRTLLRFQLTEGTLTSIPIIIMIIILIDQ